MRVIKMLVKPVLHEIDAEHGLRTTILRASLTYLGSSAGGIIPWDPPGTRLNMATGTLVMKRLFPAI